MGAALHAYRRRAQVGEQAPQKGTMQMPVAENAAAARAHSALEEVHPTVTLVAVGGHLRTAKDLVFRHGSYKMRIAMRIAKATLH